MAGFLDRLLSMASPARRAEEEVRSQQPPITRMLMDRGVYEMPMKVKRGLAKIGFEDPRFTEQDVTVGSNRGEEEFARTGLGGKIQINPEHPFVAGAYGQDIGDEEDIADAMAHEQEHREQTKRQGKFFNAMSRIRENVMQQLGKEEYGAGPLESGGFAAQAKRAAERDYESPYIPITMMREALMRRSNR